MNATGNADGRAAKRESKACLICFRLAAFEAVFSYLIIELICFQLLLKLF